MKNDFRIIGALIKRGLKLFVSDKAGVFFSLLAPLVVLVCYILFLADIQVDSLKSMVEEFGVNLDSGLIRAYVDGWMLAGVMSVSCITVSFSAQGLMIQDRERGVISDMLTSPVKRSVLSVSYLLYNFAVTLLICFAVLVVAFVYVAIAGWYLSFVDVVKIFAILILSVLSSSVLSTLVCSAIRTANAHGAFVGIMSAAIGFLIGAYMPLSTFPKAVQYIVLFMPGTYSAGVFRNLFTKGAEARISQACPQAAEGLKSGFSMNMDFFGKTIGEKEMWWIFAITIVLLIVLYFIIHAVRAKRGTLFSMEDKRFSEKFKKKKAC